MKTPEFKPASKLTLTASYAGNTRQYGPAPEGYRWRKPKEEIAPDTDYWAAGGRRWESCLVSIPEGESFVSEDGWPCITPKVATKTGKISLLEAEVVKARAALAAAEKKLSTARELVAKLEAL